MGHYLALVDDRSDVEKFYSENEEYFEEEFIYSYSLEEMFDFIDDECDLPEMVKKVITVEQLVENSSEALKYYYGCSNVKYNKERDTADFYSMFNPDGLYDWMEEGGRWEKHYLNSKGEYMTSFTLDELDVEATQKDYYNYMKEHGSLGKDIKSWKDAPIAPYYLILENEVFEIESEEDFFELIKNVSKDVVFTVYDFHM